MSCSVYGVNTSSVRNHEHTVGKSATLLVTLPMDKAAWNPAESSAAYPDYGACAAAMLSVPSTALHAGFDLIDTRGEGVLLRGEMRAALREAFGGTEPPPFAILALEGIATRAGLARIPREQWPALVRGAGAYVKTMLESQQPGACVA
jgi:hypothetical protein